MAKKYLLLFFALSFVSSLILVGAGCEKYGIMPMTRDLKVYCTDAEKQNAACTREYAPVCGDDGQTYANKCVACSSGKIDYWIEGECVMPNAAAIMMECPEEYLETAGEVTPCTREYAPVCGDDGITYGNLCVACSSGNIAQYAEGPCPEDYIMCRPEQIAVPGNPLPCTLELNPVCGNNGRSYDNACFACASGEIDGWKIGPCPGDEAMLIPGMKKCTPEMLEAEVCTLEYDPVCGENNATYATDCVACASGDLMYYREGACNE